jgi:hypothetical protein
VFLDMYYDLYVNFPLTFEMFMCILGVFLIFLITSIDLKILMKNVSIHDHFDCRVFILAFE